MTCTKIIFDGYPWRKRTYGATMAFVGDDAVVAVQAGGTHVLDTPLPTYSVAEDGHGSMFACALEEAGGDVADALANLRISVDASRTRLQPTGGAVRIAALPPSASCVKEAGSAYCNDPKCSDCAPSAVAHVNALFAKVKAIGCEHPIQKTCGECHVARTELSKAAMDSEQVCFRMLNQLDKDQIEFVDDEPDVELPDLSKTATRKGLSRVSPLVKKACKWAPQNGHVCHHMACDACTATAPEATTPTERFHTNAHRHMDAMRTCPDLSCSSHAYCARCTKHYAALEHLYSNTHEGRAAVHARVTKMKA